MFGEAPPPTDPARESGVGSLCMDSSGMSAPLRRAAMSARVSTCTCPSTLFRAAAARAAMTFLSFFSTAISSWSSGDSKSHGRGCHWSHVQRERTCFLASSVDISVICWCNCDCGCGEDHGLEPRCPHPHVLVHVRSHDVPRLCVRQHARFSLLVRLHDVGAVRPLHTTHEHHAEQRSAQARAPTCSVMRACVSLLNLSSGTTLSELGVEASP